MSQRNCPDRRELAGYVVGDLPADRAQALEEHLQVCPLCEDTLSSMEGLSDTLLAGLRAPRQDEGILANAAFLAAMEKAKRLRPDAPASPAVMTPADREADRGRTPDRPQADAGPSPGALFGNYRLIERIGRGGMGTVYRAVHTRLDRPVALKILSARQGQSAEMVRRFEREMKAIGKLDHPNLVRAHDAGETPDRQFLFLAMDLIEGEDAAKLVARAGRLPVRDACEIVRQAALGLAYVHAQGQVHRDVKPSNLMVAPDGTVRILDLGLALLSDRPGDELTGSGQLMGTADYMAPEQVEHSHRVDHRADVYSLGCTLHKLLTGQAPYPSETLMQVLMAHRTAPVPSLRTLRAEVPESLDTMFQKMVAKRPEDRFQSMTEVIACLESCRGELAESALDTAPNTRGPSGAGETVTQTAARPPAAPTAERGPGQPRTRREITRRRVLIGAAAAGVLGLLVLLGVVLRIRTPEGTLVVEVNQPNAEVTVDGGTVTIATGKDGQPVQVRVAEGKHTLQVTKGGFEVYTREFTIRSGGEDTARVELVPAKTARIDKATSPTPASALIGADGKWDLPPGAPPPAIAPFDTKNAKEHQEAWAKYLGVPVEYTNSIGMKFVLIPPGEFMMGSEESADATAEYFRSKYGWGFTENYPKERPAHRVRITSPFYLGAFEVTRGHFAKFVEHGYQADAEKGTGAFGWDTAAWKWGFRAEYSWRNPGLEQTDEHPVVCVNWYDATAFCAWLSRMEGNAYRVPTEAEWEYACRGGTQTRWFHGDDAEGLVQAGNVADGEAKAKYPKWYTTISASDGYVFTAPVGLFRPNAWGLYDMHGNVWEWCADWHDEKYYGKSPTDDPFGPDSGTTRVLRGGSWLSAPDDTRSASRIGYAPEIRESNTGFRAALSVEKVKQAIQDHAAKPATSTTGARGAPTAAPPLAVAPFDVQKAKEHQEAWAKHLGTAVEVGNSIGMMLVLIPPGEFTMGSTQAEFDEALEVAGDDKLWQAYIKSEAPRHRVTLTRPFYLAVYEVTQSQYQKVLGQSPSHYAATGRGKDAVAALDTSNFPVDTVSWSDAAEFCAKLSEKEKLNPCYFRAGETVRLLDGNGYRLPTEAEWEFACRAGTTSKYWTGDKDADLPQAGWLPGNSGGRAHAVGDLKANPFGLFDTHGNVWEWCADWWAADYYAKAPPNDPVGPSSGTHRVLRGGSWYNRPSDARSAHRYRDVPGDRFHYGGFRAALSVEGVKEAIKNGASRPADSTTGAPGGPTVAPFDGRWAGTGLAAEGKIRVAVVTGGHSFDPEAFFALFEGYPDVGYTHVAQKVGGELFASVDHFPYDVIVLYNFNQKMSPEERANFVRLLDRGVGLVVLHHAGAAYPDWPAFGKIAGGCFHLRGSEEGGMKKPGSEMKLNVTYRVHVADCDHPITRGLEDFEVADETYIRCTIQPDLRPLLTTEEPSSDKVVGGVRPQGKAKVFYTQLGHDAKVYANPSYRKLIIRAVRWVANRPTEGVKQAIEDRAPRPADSTAGAPTGLPAAPPPAVAPFDAKKAKEHQEGWAKHLGVPVETANSIGMKLVLIPPGEFDMGSPKDLIEEELRTPGNDQWYTKHLPDEGPRHHVRITKPFYLGMYEVTQEEYERVVGANPSAWSPTGEAKDKVAGQDASRFPVESVTWQEAAEFCQKLSNRPEEKAARRRYRLPSEAQWEYACRAGSTGRYSFRSARGEVSREDEKQALSECAWFGGTGGMLHTVRGKLPNTWGIYDMQGNVWEWCQDLYDSEYYANSPSDDPPGPRVGAGRVIRGGMWVGPAEYCRSAFRIRQMPGDRTGLLGFRVSLVLSDTAGEHDAANPDGSTANEPSPASSLIGPDGKWNLPPGAPPPAVAPFDPKKAKEHQEGWAKQLGAAVELSNSIGMKLALVPPGEFEMGSPQELIDEALKAPDIEEWVKPYLSAEGPRHHVRITRPFYLGVYEVTQEEFQRVMGSNPSAFCATGSRSDKVADQDTKPFPVESVTWNQAVEFCQRLSNRPEERAARRWYRLPSEAQWEYACRAGNPGRHSFSSTGGKISGEDEQRALLAYAWVADNSGGRTHAVGGKRANAWGLYDMDGNVSEWCHDGWYKDYFASSPVDDPPGPPLGWYATYTLRGGAWTFSAKHCRTAGRGGFYPAGRGGDSLGFRVSLVAWADTPPPAKPPSR